MDNNKIVDALRKVIDPDTGQDIITAGKVHEFKIEDDQVFFTLKIPGNNPQYKSELTFACIGAINEIYPEVKVNVHTETGVAVKNPLPHVKQVIAVASGKGGVGKSTIALNLALSLLKRGMKVGLLDADLYGPSIPAMLGVEELKPKVQKIMGANKIEALQANGISFISLGNIIDSEQAVVLRGPRLGGIIKQFIQDVIWPPLDVLVIDLPPGTGDIQLTMVQTIAVTGAVMVTTPQKVSVIDAVKAAHMFKLDSVNVPILGVIENMSWFSPVELPDNRYLLFGEGGGERLANHIDAPFLGQLPLVQSIGAKADHGIPFTLINDHPSIPYFDDITTKFLASLEDRKLNLGATAKVEIK